MGEFGGRDNRLCCLWYSIGLGVRGLWVSTFDVFWVLLGVVVLGGVFFGPQVSSARACACACVCVCVAWRRVIISLCNVNPMVFVMEMYSTMQELNF